MVLAITLSAFCVTALAITLYYFRHKTYGKGYVAAGAVSAIVSIFALYVGAITIGATDLVAAWLVRRSPDAVTRVLEPQWFVVIVGAILAGYLCITIRRVALGYITGNLLPTNASAMEYYERGVSPTILQLAYAHWRFLVSSKPDLPLNSPGEDPYELPPIERTVDWANLSADLLSQLEPCLDRDSFRYLEGRSTFTLTKIAAFDGQQPGLWVVYAAPEGVADNVLLEALSALRPMVAASKEPLNFVICVQSQRVRDERLTTHDGMSVRLLTEGMLVNCALDLTTYAASLIYRFEQRPIPGTDYSLSECFVRPKILSASKSDHRSDVELDLIDHLDGWSRRDNLDHISIIGEFGQGKSTALLAFCSSWAKRWGAGDRSGRIPLLIELRGKSPKRQTGEVFLGEWGQRFRLNGDALYNLVRSGRALLIFEGFDEIQDAGLRYERFQQFKALWALSYPGTRLIFTGRPNFFLDTNEMRQLLRDSRAAKQAGVDASEVYKLAFMDIPSIKSALRPIDESTRSEVIRQCYLDHTFHEIARRPSMLPVIASQWNDIKNDLRDGQGITSAKIIKGFIEFLYARKEADRDRLGQYHVLHREVRHYLTQRIAWRMASDSLRNTINIDTLSKEIADGYDWLDAEFRQVVETDMEVASSINDLNARFQGRPRAELLAAISHDVRTFGLLVSDPAGGRENMYFPHKQYYEYILGEVFWYRQNSTKCVWTKKMSDRTVSRTLLSEPLSLLFASGLWDERDLKRPVGVSRVGMMFDYLSGAVVTAPLAFRKYIAAPIEHGTRMLGWSVTRSIAGRRRESVLELPMPLRAVAASPPAIGTSRQGSQSIRSRLLVAMGTMMGIITTFNALETLATRGSGTLLASWLLWLCGILFLYTVVTLWASSRIWTLRICGIVMELYRFGTVVSVSDLNRRSRRVLAVTVARIVRTEGFGSGS